MEENEIQVIQNKIYEIRGQRVMLDFDLAALYCVETTQLKRQVKRNMERFEGEDFMFEVTWEELSRCQIGTLIVRGGNNESTSAQLDAISTALNELQAKNPERKPRRRIGFIQDE